MAVSTSTLLLTFLMGDPNQSKLQTFDDLLNESLKISQVQKSNTSINLNSLKSGTAIQNFTHYSNSNSSSAPFKSSKGSYHFNNPESFNRQGKKVRGLSDDSVFLNGYTYLAESFKFNQGADILAANHIQHQESDHSNEGIGLISLHGQQDDYSMAGLDKSNASNGGELLLANSGVTYPAYDFFMQQYYSSPAREIQNIPTSRIADVESVAYSDPDLPPPPPMIILKDPLAALKERLASIKSDKENVKKDDAKETEDTKELTEENKKAPLSFDGELKERVQARAKAEEASATTNNDRLPPEKLEEIIQREKSRREASRRTSPAKEETSKPLSEKARRMRAFAASSVKANAGSSSFLSFIGQGIKLKKVEDITNAASSAAVDPKTGLLNSLKNTMKKMEEGKTILNRVAPKEEIKVKTLEDLKSEYEQAQRNGADKFILKSLQVQIAELQEMSKKVTLLDAARKSAEIHIVKKNDLSEEARSKNQKINFFMHQSEDPVRDKEIRERILKGENRSRIVEENEKRNYEAMVEGTKSYEEPILSAVPVNSEAKTHKETGDESMSLGDDLETVSESISSGSSAVTRKPLVSEVGSTSMYDLFKKITVVEKEEDHRPKAILTHEEVINALVAQNDEIGFSTEDLDYLKAQTVSMLQMVIDDFYNEDEKSWDFSFAEPHQIISRIQSQNKAAEENKVDASKSRTIGKLKLSKAAGMDTLAAIRALGGEKTDELEEKVTSLNAPEQLKAPEMQGDTAIETEGDVPPPPPLPSGNTGAGTQTWKASLNTEKTDSGQDKIDDAVRAQGVAAKKDAKISEKTQKFPDLFANSITKRRSYIEDDEE